MCGVSSVGAEETGAGADPSLKSGRMSRTEGHWGKAVEGPGTSTAVTCLLRSGGLELGAGRRWSTWESPGTGDQGEVSGGVWRDGGGSGRAASEAAVRQWAPGVMTGPGVWAAGGSGGEGHRPEGARWAGRRRGTAPPAGLLRSWTPALPGGRFLGPALLSAFTTPDGRTFLKQNLLSLHQPSLSRHPVFAFPIPQFLCHSFPLLPCCFCCRGHLVYCTSSDIILAITGVLS